MPPWSIRRSNWRTSPPRRSTTRCGPKSSASPGCSRRIRGPITVASCCAPRRRRPIGGRGQVVYAAANRMLDAMAHRLRAEGLDCVSVQWGQWTVHFDLDADEHGAAGRDRCLPMPAADALELGMRPLGGNAIVVAFDLDRARSVLEAYGYGPLMSQLSSPDVKTAARVAEADLSQRLMELLAHRHRRRARRKHRHHSPHGRDRPGFVAGTGVTPPRQDRVQPRSRGLGSARRGVDCGRAGTAGPLAVKRIDTHRFSPSGDRSPAFRRRAHGRTAAPGSSGWEIRGLR